MNSEKDSAAHISKPAVAAKTYTISNTSPNTAANTTADSFSPRPNTINESHGNRNTNIDALRGIAILGILFMNIFFMNDSYYGYAPHLPQIQSDKILEIFSNFFLEGRFLSLLSILFGAGLLIQYRRFEANGLPAYPLIKKRLKWLIVFGLIHGIFIWGGDILLTYGISAFVALNYINSDIDTLKKRASQFIFAALALVALFSLTIEDEQYFRGSELHLQQLNDWSSAYINIVLLQLMQVGFMLLIIPFTLMWFAAGLMMWGMALYRQGVFEYGLDKNTLLKCILVAGTFSTVDSILSFSANPVLKEFSSVLMMLSAFAMAFIYIHLVVKVCQNSEQILAPFQAVGKLAFSCYILQSLIGVAIFRYGINYYSADLYMTLNRADYFLIAIVITLLQLVLAPMYLRYFKQGPLEALWRSLVMKKLPANNRLS
ncbi:DUF418 domain-containing protein [Shewanella olleyana]|uniref:DUF418 domain-containing protein n=1 Tax=Shewanella olleyana TaxID=135626 RepID=UPI00200D5D02|nr:DUF418 domain-containing protein [Shewanella olleyana]MCL1067195.1 DUF418 domain-containing protein [Shewanella olleyana]